MRAHRLGIRQLRYLMRLGNPWRSILVQDKAALQLVALGYLGPAPANRRWPAGALTRITPKGLRALADALESGRVDKDLGR